jgi:hypothetical protein
MGGRPSSSGGAFRSGTRVMSKASWAATGGARQKVAFSFNVAEPPAGRGKSVGKLGHDGQSFGLGQQDQRAAINDNTIISHAQIAIRHPRRQLVD